MASSSAKVVLLYVEILHDRGGRALADDAPRVEAHDALREAHHRLHDVLDHDDGDAALVQRKKNLQHLLDLGTGKAGHRLVGDEELRPRGHGARELELAQLDLREPVRLRARHVGERREAAEVLRDAAYFEEGVSHRLNRPRMPSGASTTNSTSSTPMISTFTSPEMVTVTICCKVESSSAPRIGPPQCDMPPMMALPSAEMV